MRRIFDLITQSYSPWQKADHWIEHTHDRNEQDDELADQRTLPPIAAIKSWYLACSLT
jgi:hypothetical protein